MRRSFLTRTIICLIPTLIATAVVVWAYAKDPVNLTGFIALDSTATIRSYSS